MLPEGRSQPGQTELDLFCGAGTAAVEAIHAGRHAIANDPSAVALRVPLPTATHGHPAPG